MITNEPLLPEPRRIKTVSRDHPADGESVLATRDHEVIREWARLFDADPATGEASASGPSSAMKVSDGGAGLRFNFPGIGRFREITWAEWFDHFNSHDLTFVYENPATHRPPSPRYRLVRTEDLNG
jgi:hypothetical protein